MSNLWILHYIKICWHVTRARIQVCTLKVLCLCLHVDLINFSSHALFSAVFVGRVFLRDTCCCLCVQPCCCTFWSSSKRPRPSSVRSSWRSASSSRSPSHCTTSIVGAVRQHAPSGITPAAAAATRKRAATWTKANFQRSCSAPRCSPTVFRDARVYV